MDFPLFSGLPDECASNFCDEFELACIVTKRNREETFAFVLKSRAKKWYYELPKAIRSNWDLLKKTFIEEFQPKVTTQELVEAFQELRQMDVHGYSAYKEAFFHRLSCLDSSSRREEATGLHLQEIFH